MEFFDGFPVSETHQTRGQNVGELIEALGGAHQIGIEGVLVHGLRFMLPAELGLTLETPLS